MTRSDLRPEAAATNWQAPHDSRHVPAAADPDQDRLSRPEGGAAAHTLSDMPGCRLVQVSLLRSPSSVPLVRALIQGIAGLWELDGLLVRDIELVACELATNAILHGEPSCLGCFELVLAPVPKGLRIEVTDRGTERIVLPVSSSTAESGRGLLIVSALCERWGAERTNDGNVVWAELGGCAA